MFGRTHSNTKIPTHPHKHTEKARVAMSGRVERRDLAALCHMLLSESWTAPILPSPSAGELSSYVTAAPAATTLEERSTDALIDTSASRPRLIDTSELQGDFEMQVVSLSLYLP